MRHDKKKLFYIASGSAFVTSLCCVTPVVLFLLGLSTVSAAGALSNTLYYGYRWAFALVGLTFLGIALFFYFKQKGVCHFDDVKKNKRMIFNIVILMLIVSTIIYFIWNFIILKNIETPAIMETTIKP